MKYSKVHQLEDIELSSKVVVSDPCYGRDTWCMGFLGITPGTYETKLFYSDEGSWGCRVAKLGIYRKGASEAVEEKVADFHVGVDSGQAGIFDDSVYPVGETGEYGDKESFYGKVCNLTLGEGHDDRQERAEAKSSLREVETGFLKDMPEENKKKYRAHYEERLAQPEVPYWQGGTYEGKGVVSSSGYGDGGYDCIVGTDSEGNTSYVEIVFIDDSEEEQADIDEEVEEKERTVKESGTL